MLEEIWTTTPSGLRCTIHGEEFARIGACSQCADVLTPDDAPPELVIPEGCISVQQLERRFVALAKLAENQARAALDGEDWHERALAPKFIDCALKSLRAAAAIATTRANEHRVTILLHEAKKLKARH